jgi:CRP/FNR family cyclic AMP-dependent transcriptional regulator
MAASDSAPRQLPRAVHLLAADPELGDTLTEAKRRVAFQALVTRVIDICHGDEGALAEWQSSSGLVGLLALRGLLVQERELAGQSAAELLGPGDLIVPSVESEAGLLPLVGAPSWRLLTPVRLAVIDAGLLERARPWPEVLWELTRRAVERSQRVTVQLAICNRQRIDDRVLLLLSQYAERWGSVTPRGVRLKLPLTHVMLGKLVGAHRPSVTTALGSLADRGLLLRDADGHWLLPQRVEDGLRTRANRP